jgi:alkanesulfonate monooxygenase SsuD/methylene tetrahydromethanopterin reductase-like flavin-dependent oxidoreductase (luciferase family)
LARVFTLYADTMREAGFSDLQVDSCLDQCWVWREAYLAETDDQALDEFIPAFVGATKHLIGIQERWNPKDIAMPTQTIPLDRDGYGIEPDPELPQQLVGSPRRVAEQIAALRDAGVRNLMLTHRSLMSREKIVASLRMLSEHIAPKFR